MELSFEQYLNIRWAAGATFRSDGARMAFITDITGTGQLWVMDGPLEWPDQLTFFEDRLMFARYSPTEPIIAFGKDVGGNENQLVYIVSDEGGDPEQLSVVDAKHLWGGWSPDGQKIAWSHNGRNGRDFDVYVYDLATGEETMVVQADGYWYVADWRPDGEALYVARFDSNSNNDVYLVELDGSPPELLTAHEGQAVYSDIHPIGDGSQIWLATNVTGEFMNLARLDVTTGELDYPDRGANWDVEGLELSDDERWLVVQRNEAGYTKTKVWDQTSGEGRVIEGLPDGLAGPPRFVPGSDRFCLTVRGTADSCDVWVVDAATGETERWTRSAMAGVPRTSLVEPELIEYESFDGLAVQAFYWVPPDAEPPYPVVIDIHGGPEAQRRPNMSANNQYYLTRGVACLAPNVRGSRGYGKSYMALDDVRKRMHSVADIKAAHAWLVEHGDADADRIAVLGGSYGGFMVLSSMVTYPDLWAAGVDIVGVANFVTFLENTSDYRRHLREEEYGSLEHDREFLLDISPLTHIDKISAPLMVIHGRNDPRVPVSEAEQVVEACRAKGLPVESVIYEDEGHGLAKRKNRLDAAPRILDFLAEHLDLISE